MKKVCLINQPAGIGDVFFTQKIVDKFLNEETLNENEIKLGHALYDLFNDYENIFINFPNLICEYRCCCRNISRNFKVIQYFFI